MKKTIATIFQALVTLALLYWLFHDPQKRADMALALSTATKSWFFLGFAVYAIVEIIGTLRWQILLRVQGIHLPFRRVFGLFMIGIFFNVFMPGAIGGDVVKIYYLLKETSTQKAAAFLTVLMDRLIGLVALIAVSAVIVGPQYQMFLQTPTLKALFVALVIVLASAIGSILISIVVTSSGLVHKLPSSLPFHDKLVEMAAAYALYGRAWKASLVAFFLSVGAHLCFFLTFYFTARAFTSELTWQNVFTVMPIVNTITALPISVSGVGVREGLFEQLLGGMYGIPNQIALLISLAGFLIIVLWSAIGGLFYLAYRPSEHAGIAEMEAEVSEIEEQITHDAE